MIVGWDWGIVVRYKYSTGDIDVWLIVMIKWQYRSVIYKYRDRLMDSKVLVNRCLYSEWYDSNVVVR